MYNDNLSNLLKHIQEDVELNINKEVKESEVNEVKEIDYSDSDRKPDDVTSKGTKFWRNEKGELHRGDDKPAVMRADGSKFWFKNGMRHRDDDKPAIEYASGVKYWYENGIEYTPKVKEVKEFKLDEAVYGEGDRVVVYKVGKGTIHTVQDNNKYKVALDNGKTEIYDEDLLSHILEGEEVKEEKHVTYAGAAKKTLSDKEGEEIKQELEEVDKARQEKEKKEQALADLKARRAKLIQAKEEAKEDEEEKINESDTIFQEGDEVKIDPSYGGGQGIVVEPSSSGKFYIVNVNGENKSFHASDITLISVEEEIEESKVNEYIGQDVDYSDPNREPDDVDSKGNKFWYDKEGRGHRDGDQPAAIYADGSKFWLKHGRQHRESDKPAEIDADGTKKWYKDGEPYTPEVKEAKINEVEEISIEDFIKRYKDYIDEIIKLSGFEQEIDDKERERQVMNNKGLYNLAKSKGVEMNEAQINEGNMPHCRWENTLEDLEDVYGHIDDEDLSDSEDKARKKVISLCIDIAQDYGDVSEAKVKKEKAIPDEEFAKEMDKGIADVKKKYACLKKTVEAIGIIESDGNLTDDQLIDRITELEGEGRNPDNKAQDEADLERLKKEAVLRGFRIKEGKLEESVLNINEFRQMKDIKNNLKSSIEYLNDIIKGLEYNLVEDSLKDAGNAMNILKDLLKGIKESKKKVKEAKEDKVKDGYENPKGLWVVAKDGRVFNEEDEEVGDKEIVGKYKTEYKARYEAWKVKQGK